MKFAGESLKNLAIRSLLGLKGFGAWLAGVFLDWVFGKVSKHISDQIEERREKKRIEDNQGERRKVTEETETLIREKQSRGEILTEEEIDAIRKKKIEQEEDLFNGGN